MTDFRVLIEGKISSYHKNQMQNGIFYLKGGDLYNELAEIPNFQYKISDYFEEDFFVTKKVVYVGY